MSRLPGGVFAALVAATVGAFFLTQHLKVQNPFINGAPRPDPPAINPIAGRMCTDLAGKSVSFKSTRVGFFLQTHAQAVDVLVFNSQDQEVATATGSGRFVRPPNYVYYSWNGHLADGVVAPDGVYHFRVSLPSKDRTIQIGAPVRVITVPPSPQVTRVTLTGTDTGSPIISPPGAGQAVTIHFKRGDWRSSQIEIIRTDQPGGPHVVFSYGAAGAVGKAGWNGEIDGVPAPAGTYLVGMQVTDAACNIGRFPIVSNPPPGSTPDAGVTVRYLAALPPLVPVPAGATTTVFVDSRKRPYTWSLSAIGASKVLAHGAVGAARAATGAAAVRVPTLGAGVYQLALRSGQHRTAVPLVAAAAHGAAAKVLVVLPALTWQGLDPVDDTGDGIPDTLLAGDQIDLVRPLVDGLPAGLDDEVAVLRFLSRQHDSFQLTTDLALAEGTGPSLRGRTGVLLDGSFKWLPASLGPELRAFVEHGGRVVSIGTGSLQATAPVHAGADVRTPTAGPPAALSPDPFGAHHGATVPHTGLLITVLDDELGIFGSAPTFQGFTSYQQITPPTGVATSEAGVATGIPAIAGFRLGAGTVVEIGLPAFASRLPSDVDAQGLLAQLWALLSA